MQTFMEIAIKTLFLGLYIGVGLLLQWTENKTARRIGCFMTAPLLGRCFVWKKVRPR